VDEEERRIPVSRSLVVQAEIIPPSVRHIGNVAASVALCESVEASSPGCS
jgi:hypothetical protein